MAYGQFIGACQAPAPRSGQGGEAARAPGGRFFELVPSMCVSERFDSNVFFRSSTNGFEREDYVTSVNPRLRVNHNGPYATGFLDMGGVSETYAKNSELNFLGSNGNLSLDLNSTVKKLLPNAGVLITDAVSYIPTPPGFVNPLAGTSPGDPANMQDVFAQGILFSRTNRVTNRGTVSGAYDLSATTRVNASYSHSILRFLGSPVTAQGNVPGALFSTTVQAGTVGGSTQVSNVDRLNIQYSHVQSEFERGAVSAASFQTETVTVGWSRVFTPNITMEAGGGGIFIDPGGATYAANAALIVNVDNTRSTLSYTRSAFPSFSGVPTQVVGDVVSLVAVQQISLQWTLSGGANYSSRSSGASESNSITFNSYGGSVNLAYLIARGWSVTLGYNYVRFDREFGAFREQFDRHVASVGMRASWE